MKSSALAREPGLNDSRGERNTIGSSSLRAALQTGQGPASAACGDKSDRQSGRRFPEQDWKQFRVESLPAVPGLKEQADSWSEQGVQLQVVLMIGPESGT